jgi:hypothetical protein
LFKGGGWKHKRLAISTFFSCCMTERCTIHTNAIRMQQFVRYQVRQKRHEPSVPD